MKRTQHGTAAQGMYAIKIYARSSNLLENVCRTSTFYQKCCADCPVCDHIGKCTTYVYEGFPCVFLGNAQCSGGLACVELCDLAKLLVLPVRFWIPVALITR